MATPAKRRRLTVVNSEPEQPAEQQPVAQDDDKLMVLLALVFTVDGKPAFHVPFQTKVDRPTAQTDVMQMRIALDGRQLAQLLEPALGPSKASQIWTPGAPA